MKWIVGLHDIKRWSMTRRDHQDAKEQSGQPTDHSRTENPFSQFPILLLRTGYINFHFHGTISLNQIYCKYTEYRESKMIVQNNLLSVCDRNIRFGTVTKNNCFYKNVRMSLISSCVWASKPILTEFAPARILGQHIWTREIILKNLGPTPFKNLPKNQFLIFTNNSLSDFYEIWKK